MRSKLNHQNGAQPFFIQVLKKSASQTVLNIKS